jgi:hypothetical protein
METIDPDTIDDFTRAFLTAALWSSHDESTPDGGEPMDKKYGIENISQDALSSFKADCKKFQASEVYTKALEADACKYKGCPPEEYAGHDFWLTRVGHGAGFWDGQWEEPFGTHPRAFVTFKEVYMSEKKKVSVVIYRDVTITQRRTIEIEVPCSMQSSEVVDEAHKFYDENMEGIAINWHGWEQLHEETHWVPDLTEEDEVTEINRG